VRARIAFVGRHQLANAALAAAAAVLAEPALTADALREGLAQARWPGRLECAPTEPRLWWDGAHNPQGALALREAWREALGDPPATLVLGLSADKDASAMLAALEGPWSRVLAVAADSPRARAAEEVATLVAAAWPGVPVVACASVAEAVARGLEEPGLVLACGSLFVVGEAMAAAGASDLEQL